MFFLCVSVDTNYTPDGKMYNTIKCLSSPNDCIKRARDICQGTYQLLNSYSMAGNVLGEDPYGGYTWYSMEVQCGASDGSIVKKAREDLKTERK